MPVFIVKIKDNDMAVIRDVKSTAGLSDEKILASIIASFSVDYMSPEDIEIIKLS